MPKNTPEEDRVRDLLVTAYKRITKIVLEVVADVIAIPGLPFQTKKEQLNLFLLNLKIFFTHKGVK